jgi:hypothetical protein
MVGIDKWRRLEYNYSVKYFSAEAFAELVVKRGFYDKICVFRHR